AGRRYFAAAARPAEVAVPEAALFAAAGRFDVAGFYAVLGDFTAADAREAMEKDLERFFGAVIGKAVVREVLPAVGPDWGVYAVPPADSGEVLPRVVAAVRVDGTGAEPADEALLGAVHLWAQMAVMGHNKLHPSAPARVKPRVIEKARARVVEGLPAGLLPAYGLRGGFLVLTSHADEFGRFAAGRTPAAVRVSLAGCRAYLRSHREPLAELLARGGRRDEVLARLDAAGEVAGLFTRLEVAHEGAAGRVTFAATLKPAEPFRK
ncbi:MAG: hypothetical protein ACRC33_07710, partial [Gemmataceae bacterium]